ncbi:MAG: translocation/assembly module TamB domain-containing protein [Paludibacter sp.]|nr:translocation/assembly module TamB domain-containing protein [Paludibacter sp.]
MLKGIKKTLNIIRISVSVIIILLAMIPILLQSSKIQRFISDTVVYELTGLLHTKVTVGLIDYKLFNAIDIHDLYVEDLKQDTLIYTKEATAHFSFWRFFNGKIFFKSVEFNELYANLKVDTMGVSNLDFVIKAFSKNAKNDSSNVVYKVERFQLKNSKFSYTNDKLYKDLPSNIFNINRMKFFGLNLDLSLNELKKDTLSAEIKYLNAKEKSGIIIQDISTLIFASNKGVSIPSLNIQLPASRLLFEDVSLKYDSLADLKNFIQKVKLYAPIHDSYISLSDLKSFIPDLKNVHGIASLNGLVAGRISNLKIQKLELTYGKSVVFNADVDVSGLPNLDEAFIYCQINELHAQTGDLQDFISQFSQKPFLLPKELNQLGLIRYKGNITGFLNNLVAYGNFNTNLGSVSTDILIQLENKFRDLKYNGTLKTNNFMLGKLLNNKQLGKVSFDFNTKGSKLEFSAIKGSIVATVPLIEFNGYSYRDIHFGGKYDGNGFDGKVEVQDENIHANFNGIIDLTQKLPIFDFELKLMDTNLNALHLIKTYPGATLSFNAKTNMVGNSLDNINGFLRFDSIVFNNKRVNKTLNVDNVRIVSRIENSSSFIGIESDVINGAFSGNFKYSTIGETINQIVQKYLPALSAVNSIITANREPNHIDVNLKIENTEDISDVMELPYKLEGISTVNGSIDEKTNKINFNGLFPTITLNKLHVNNLSLFCENQNNKLNLTTRAQVTEKLGQLNMFLVASADKDSLNTKLGWQNTNEVTNAGEIVATTKLRNESGKIAAKVDILPTQIIIADSIWNLHAGTINLNTDSTINIKDFLFDSKKQFIKIDGIASKSQKDSLMVTMNDLNLEFILKLLQLKTITIGGFVTGKATLFKVLHEPVFEAKLDVKKVALNDKPIGDAKLISTWDRENNQMVASGIFWNDKKDTIALAHGVFIPHSDSLDFLFKAHNLPIEFLSPYLESVVQNVKGYGSGYVRMYGPSKTLGFSGNVYVDKAQASVKMLKTTYFFNDTVRLKRKSIEFENVKVYDEERNQGVMSGRLNHNGTFKEMVYDVNLESKNILALNTKNEDNDYFFGKAYANGKVHIYGDEKVANIDVDAVSQPNTKCFINMGGASSASDNSFIRFVNKNIVQKEVVETKSPTKKGINVKVNLQLEATPAAEMELLIDPKGGDVITGKGNGNLRVEFDSYSDLKLYGTYTISNGYYLFTLQNLIRKEFKIDQGSTLAWTGDPFNAQVDIRALYSLTASLRDLLDESDLLSISRTTVPVNCELKLTDNLMKPSINFGIDLPSSEERVKQLVNNIINTDEMMNRQILYLLVFNKFYLLDNASSSTTTNNLGANEALSFAVSTASAQLNSWLTQMIKSNNFSFGIDYSKTDLESSDVQAQINYQPNNRWVLNGNFGYRTDIYSTNTNRFISDVDIEYLLSEAGKLRLKGYSHTVDRYRLTNNGISSQGFGIIYKEEFATVDDLFKYYWRLLTGKQKNEIKNDTTEIKK